MRFFPKAAIAVLVSLSVSQIVRAEPLHGDQIRDLVAGKTIFLATPYGLELPLRYQADGIVAGDISGFSLARMFTPREEGRWWVDGPRLCQKWASWYDGKTLCFTITRTGAGTISWVRQDGLSGEARIRG